MGYNEAMTSAALSAHRLVVSLDLKWLPDLAASSSFPLPCLDLEGRDLLFKALYNPGWSKGRPGEAAQQALVQWLQRPDVDPFAPQLVPVSNKKTKPTYQSSWERALDLGMETLVVSMLQSQRATPEKMALLRKQSKVDVLTPLVTKNLSQALTVACEKGWDIHQCDDTGKSLWWHARSHPMVEALSHAGLSTLELGNEELRQHLVRKLPRKEVDLLMDTLAKAASPHQDLNGTRLAVLLDGLADLWCSNNGFEKIIQGFFAAREKLSGWVEEASSPLATWRFPIERGAYKGQLSATALFVRFAERRSNEVVGLLYGQELLWFGNKPTYLRDGVSDLGLWKLFNPDREELFNAAANTSNQSDGAGRWHEQALKAYETIEALHSQEEWKRWRLETALSLSKAPTVELFVGLNRWIGSLTCQIEEEKNWADDGSKALRQISRALNEVEQALEGGVLLMGEAVTEDLEAWMSRVQVPPGYQELVNDLRGQRDRLLLACLGNERRFSKRLQNLGVRPTLAWRDNQQKTNGQELFLPERLDHLSKNPLLFELVKQGAKQALDLNMPHPEVLKAALLHAQWKPAEQGPVRVRL